jgi:YD repeat-containing protein
VTLQTDARGNTSQSVSDIFGRTMAHIDALGNRSEMTYNRIGELLEQKDAMGRVTRFVYDNLGRRVEVIFPKPSPTEKSPVRKTVYNVVGQVVQEIDPLGNAMSVEYDAFGRRVAVIDAEGGRTEFTYDVNGKMLSLKDPVGNVTSYVYDDAGRMIEETNALGKTRKFEYEGRTPVRKTDRNGRVIEFEYNDFGRPITEKWLDVDGTLVETIAYQFDALGKMTQVADSSGVQTFEYDELDRNTQTVMQFAGLESPVTFNTAFDAMNRRTQVATKIGDAFGFANSYSYDALGKVTGIAQNEKRVDYTYNAAGQRTSTSVFAGSK